MTSTSAMREAWGPPCAGNFSTITVHGGGRIRVKTAAVPAFLALNECLKRHNYLTKADQTGAYNCLAGETQVITRDGWEPISALVGRDVELLVPRGPVGTNAFGGPGAWVSAEVRSFGEQPLRQVVVERYGVQRVIHATPDHRWFVRPEDSNAPWREVVTDDLEPREGRKGHRLRSIRPQSVASRTAPSSVGIVAGLVYGDGTLDQQGARVALCGAKNEALLDHFPTEQVRHRYHYDTHAEAQTIVTGLPRSWKNSAPHDEGPAHTYGWLAGYFTADGRVGENGQCELNSADEWRLEEARRVALSLGITTSPITSIKRETNYSGEVSTLYSLRIDPRSLDSSFFLIPEHRERWNGEMRKAPPDWSVVSVTETDRVEEVFCAVVPDVESFAIEDFILTGNCRKITGGSGYSLHAYGIAADLNWSTNPYGSRLVTDMPGAMIADIKAIRTNNGKQVFRWGGDYKGNKDAMHFEVICTPADLATGLRGGPTPTSHPVDLAAFLQQTVACSTNTFRRGETGACIGVIQRICSTKFAQSISVDGDFGPATEQAVKAVQRQRGVTDDGIVGPQTWAKMME